jgi:FlaA1/EpsC-like NDP-sugar epimerase
MIKNKRILITGGAGSIGSELVRQLAPQNKIFILDQNETGAFDLREELKQDGYWVHSRTGDIRDPKVLSDVFEDFKPQYVFHAAALKHVTPNEEYPIEAIQTNIIGTYNVMSESKRWECLEKFVFISTDKVINGHSIMGATKRVGEIMVRNQGKGFIAVRFGNVLGSRGSVIPLWQNQINRGKPLTVTDPRMTRFFMTIPEAVNLVIKAGEEGEGGEIFILDMGEQVNILQLANKILNESKLQPLPGKQDIQIIGLRPGETLDEKLMTLEEEKIAIKSGNFYIIK